MEVAKTLEKNSIPVPVQLAAQIGLNEAVILQQINYWMSKEYGRVIDGVRWIYNSYQEWQTQMPFLNLSMIRRAIARLEGRKLIKSERLDEKRWNQTKFYTIDYEELKALQLSICSIEADRDDTIEQIEVSKLSSSYTETTSEITPETAAAVDEKEKVVEEVNIQLTPQLRKLLLDYSTEEVRQAIAHYCQVVKNKGSRQNPAGWFTECLRGKWWATVEETKPVVEPKDYPHPTLEQLNALGAVGRIVHTTLDEPGYPQVLAVDTGAGVLPWWQALNRHAPPDMSQTALGQI